MRRNWLALATWVGLLVCALGTPPATAGPEQEYFLGLPWESGIVRGVESQRRAEKGHVPPATLVGRAERAARRKQDVVTLYLLARAYGLRALWSRDQGVAKARDQAAKDKFRLGADRDHASAISTYNEVLRKAPRCYFAYHDMAVLEMRRERPDTRRAFDWFQTAWRLNGRYTPPQRQIVKMYLEAKQYAAALPFLQTLVNLDPEDQEARERLVVALADQKMHAVAYTEVDKLLAQRPGHARYLALRAHLDVQTARYDRAIDTYKRLARSNPNVPTAFLGIMDCLKQVQAKKLPFDLADMLFALKGIHRLMRDAAERTKIEGEIRRLEHAMAAPPAGAPDGTPTVATLLHALKGPDGDKRLRALIALMLREEPPTAEIVRAVALHLDPLREPEASVRAGAVRAVGRMSGTALAPLLRVGLSDRDPRVRLETTDTLVGIATRDQSVAGAVIVILGRTVGDAHVGVASSARQGILQLSGAVLTGLPAESDDVAHRRAFGRWWAGAAGEGVQIDALGEYHRLKDRDGAPIIVPYLDSASLHVFRAAYSALRKAAPLVVRADLRRWYAALPRFEEDDIKPEQWQSVKGALHAWAAGRPGA